MTEERVTIARNGLSQLALAALYVSLMIAVVCLAYVASTQRQSSSVLSGNLQVAYMLVTLKTATSEEASGSTISASRVEYLPHYVLVTSQNGTTYLWPIERLKKLEVSRSKSAADS